MYQEYLKIKITSKYTHKHINNNNNNTYIKYADEINIDMNTIVKAVPFSFPPRNIKSNINLKLTKLKKKTYIQKYIKITSEKFSKIKITTTYSPQTPPNQIVE